MISRSRHLIKYIVKRNYWLPNINTKKTLDNFIDYEKYVEETKEQITDVKKEVNDIHMYYKHLTNKTTEQYMDIKRIQYNVSAINQLLNEQKYWIFHSVLLSYIGLFTYIFKM
jgi:predicted  nucleic acid-binding Zn-ribbon protein